jgi:hypothetical protein
VAPAFEAVACTLTHLDLEDSSGHQGDDVGAGYELGAAVGKLRRLKDLTLDVSQDGRFYHAMARGLTANGGDRPLPRLWRVSISRSISYHVESRVSLILPSVRVFSSCHGNSREALLTACALGRVGYEFVWGVHGQLTAAHRDTALAIAQCKRAEIDDMCAW